MIILSSTSCEKPSLTIKQDSPIDSAMVTFTKNGTAVNHYTTNGGKNWILYAPLATGSNYNGNNKSYTFASSYPGGNGGNFIATWVSNDGDSINVRRGVLGNMGTTVYKRNSVVSATNNQTVAAIFKSNGNLYSFISYAGYYFDRLSNTRNVFSNSENLSESGSSPMGSSTDMNKLNNEIVTSYSLSQNYPNPFNPTTNIKFDIPRLSNVKLTVYNITGREVALLVDEELQTGSYEYKFDASNLSSGVYLYKIQATGFVQIKKMMLLK